jgi:hypothetical protein
MRSRACARWAKALGDDLTRYDNELGAKNQYRTTVRKKAALIVIDDVWKAADIEPLRAGGPDVVRQTASFLEISSRSYSESGPGEDQGAISRLPLHRRTSRHPGESSPIVYQPLRPQFDVVEVPRANRTPSIREDCRHGSSETREDGFPFNPALTGQ